MYCDSGDRILDPCDRYTRPGYGCTDYIDGDNDLGDRFTDPITFTDPGYVYTDPGDQSWMDLQRVSDLPTPNIPNYL